MNLRNPKSQESKTEAQESKIMLQTYRHKTRQDAPKFNGLEETHQYGK